MVYGDFKFPAPITTGPSYDRACFLPIAKTRQRLSPGHGQILGQINGQVETGPDRLLTLSALFAG